MDQEMAHCWVNSVAVVSQPPVTSNSSAVWIRFSADGSFTGRGFQLSYTTGEYVILEIYVLALTRRGRHTDGRRERRRR